MNYGNTVRDRKNMESLEHAGKQAKELILLIRMEKVLTSDFFI